MCLKKIKQIFILLSKFCMFRKLNIDTYMFHFYNSGKYSNVNKYFILKS